MIIELKIVHTLPSQHILYMHVYMCVFINNQGTTTLYAHTTTMINIGIKKYKNIFSCTSCTITIRLKNFEKLHKSLEANLFSC